jgi:hypothetical protein
LGVPGCRDRKHQLVSLPIQRKLEGRAALRLGGDDRLKARPRRRVRPKAQQVAAAFGVARDQAVGADRGYRREPLFECAGAKRAGGWGWIGHCPEP